MKVIIIADSVSRELAPLTRRVPHPLLPLAGKPVLMHALEILHRGGLRDVEIVSATYAGRLEQSLDTGHLIGMNISYHGEMPALDQRTVHTLVTGLVDLVDTHWGEELDRLGDLKLHALLPIRMTVSARTAAILLPPCYGSPVPPDWADIHLLDSIILPVASRNVIETGTFTAYMESSFALLRGEYKLAKPAGREFSPGHWSSPKAQFDKGSLRSDHGQFGEYSRIDRSARLTGDIVIGDRAVVGKGARLHNSIVLDGTYIGQNMDCANAIVAGNLLIRVDRGVCVEVDDPVLFCAVA